MIYCEVCKQPVEEGALVYKVYNRTGGQFIVGLARLAHVKCPLIPRSRKGEKP